MPMTSILVLAGIVAAFATFGIVLAWGDRQTRDLNRQGTRTGSGPQGRPEEGSVAHRFRETGGGEDMPALSFASVARYGRTRT